MTEHNEHEKDGESYSDSDDALELNEGMIQLAVLIVLLVSVWVIPTLWAKFKSKKDKNSEPKSEIEEINQYESDYGAFSANFKSLGCHTPHCCPVKTKLMRRSRAHKSGCDFADVDSNFSNESGNTGTERRTCKTSKSGNDFYSCQSKSTGELAQKALTDNLTNMLMADTAKGGTLFKTSKDKSSKSTPIRSNRNDVIVKRR